MQWRPRRGVRWLPEVLRECLGLGLPQRSLACLSICFSLDPQICVSSHCDLNVGRSHSPWGLLAGALGLSLYLHLFLCTSSRMCSCSELAIHSLPQRSSCGGLSMVLSCHLWATVGGRSPLAAIAGAGWTACLLFPSRFGCIEAKMECLMTRPSAGWSWYHVAAGLIFLSSFKLLFDPGCLPASRSPNPQLDGNRKEGQRPLVLS